MSGLKFGDYTTRTRKYNVAYEDSGVTKLYLAMNVSRKEAEKYLERFKSRYENKPYPNGKGFYTVSNPRVVAV